MAHDDLLDSLAYIDQIATVSYFEQFEVINDYAYVIDEVAGY